MKKQKVIILWVITNWVAIALSVFAFLFSYALLQTGDFMLSGNRLKRVVGFLFCLAIQGGCLAGPQALILRWGAYTASWFQWLSVTVSGMLLGGCLPLIPILFSLVGDRNQFPYLSASFVAAWLVGGFFGGRSVARGKLQKRQWGVINAGAFLLYLLALCVIPPFIFAALDGAKTASGGLLLVVVCIYLPLTTLGSLLNGSIIKALAEQNADKRVRSTADK